MQEGMTHDEKVVFYETLEALRMVSVARYGDTEAAWKAFVDWLVGRTPDEILQEARRISAEEQRRRESTDEL